MWKNNKTIFIIIFCYPFYSRSFVTFQTIIFCNLITDFRGTSSEEGYLSIQILEKFELKNRKFRNINFHWGLIFTMPQLSGVTTCKYKL